ncbi:MAG TPA: dipeptidase [Steroidobacteraceae bacterium]|nr:dipeptidase [Steroidobacteraceae bacterium]
MSPRRVLAAHVAAAALAFLAAGAAHADPALERARRLLERSILFDGHNDLPWAIHDHKAAPGDVAAYDIRGRAPDEGQTDIPRLRAGRVSAQFWSVYIPPEAGRGFARMQLEQIDVARRLIARYPDTFQLAGTAAEIRAAKRAGRIGSMLGIEGGHAIEDSLGVLRTYYDLGVRYMTLTHNVHTNWADAALHVPAKHRGLSPFGEQVVREMNRLGMLVDLSHTAPDTMHDALRVSQAPVIFSHSAARALCEIPRNVPDDVLAKLPANGGVVMVTFVSGFISQAAADVTLPAMQQYLLRASGKSEAERDAIYKEIFDAVEIPPVTVAAVADHIEHVRKVASVDNIGIGSDFDGNSDWPEGLSDVSTFPNLFAELIRRGWSDRDLEKLAGGNVLRALEQAEGVARRLQRETTPSTARLGVN